VSCGAAALATIFNYYYGERVGEQELVREMLELGDKEKIRKEGFSLLEIKRFAERQGYVSRGYRLGDVKDLTRLAPQMARVEREGNENEVPIGKVRVGEIAGVKQALPAHGHPFADLRARTEAIKRHHLERLEKVKEISRELGPATVGAISRRLFAARSWGPMAESETYAHLEHLRHAGEAECLAARCVCR